MDNASKDHIEKLTAQVAALQQKLLKYEGVPEPEVPTTVYDMQVDPYFATRVKYAFTSDTIIGVIEEYSCVLNLREISFLNGRWFGDALASFVHNMNGYIAYCSAKDRNKPLEMSREQRIRLGLPVESTAVRRSPLIRRPQNTGEIGEIF